MTPHQAQYNDNLQRDLIDALLRAKHNAENNNTAEVNSEALGLSDDHILMTVGDIFGAGAETTVTVLRWAIIYLIHYPEVMFANRAYASLQVELKNQLIIDINAC